MNFYFDENLPPTFAKVIRAALGDKSPHKVYHLRADNVVPAGTTDAEVLAKISQDDPKPVFLTCDIHIRTDKPAADVLRRSGVHVVFFTSSFFRLTDNYQCASLLRQWDGLLYEIKKSKKTLAIRFAPTTFTRL